MGLSSVLRPCKTALDPSGSSGRNTTPCYFCKSLFCNNYFTFIWVRSRWLSL